MPVLDSSLWHNSWLEDPWTADTNNQQGKLGFDADSTRWESWVSKLRFDMVGGERGRNGNGFFVNIPNEKYDILLTAGHNLIDPAGARTENLIILKGGKTGEDLEVDPTNVRICKEYAEEPGELSAAFDYGVILIERDKNKPRRGFGFSLILGDVGLNGVMPIEGDVSIGGYRPGDDPQKDRPRKSSGKCLACRDAQLEYDVEAAEGISGGPVWVGYKGLEQ